MAKAVLVVLTSLLLSCAGLSKPPHLAMIPDSEFSHDGENDWEACKLKDEAACMIAARRICKGIWKKFPHEGYEDVSFVRYDPMKVREQERWLTDHEPPVVKAGYLRATSDCLAATTPLNTACNLGNMAACDYMIHIIVEPDRFDWATQEERARAIVPTARRGCAAGDAKLCSWLDRAGRILEDDAIKAEAKLQRD